MNLPSAEAQSLLDMIGGGSEDLPPTKLVARLRSIPPMATKDRHPALLSVADYPFDSAGRALTMRVYRPEQGLLPAIVFFFGGAFVSGTLEACDPAMRILASRTGWAVVSAEYSLAPENPYPAAPEDCYAALCAVRAQSTNLSIDASRIVVSGESSGGLLAAAAALMARDRSGPVLAGLICVSASFDLLNKQERQHMYPSLAQHDGKVLDLKDITKVVQLYTPDPLDRIHPYASPGLARSLRSLPPALIVTGECDPFRDEGTAFADRLRAEGVRADLVCLKGAVHGVVGMMPAMPEAGAALIDNVTAFLNKLRNIQA